MPCPPAGWGSPSREEGSLAPAVDNPVPEVGSPGTEAGSPGSEVGSPARPQSPGLGSPGRGVGSPERSPVGRASSSCRLEGQARTDLKDVKICGRATGATATEQVPAAILSPCASWALLKTASEISPHLSRREDINLDKKRKRNSCL